MRFSASAENTSGMQTKASASYLLGTCSKDQAVSWCLAATPVLASSPIAALIAASGQLRTHLSLAGAIQGVTCGSAHVL